MNIIESFLFWTNICAWSLYLKAVINPAFPNVNIRPHNPCISSLHYSDNKHTSAQSLAVLLPYDPRKPQSKSGLLASHLQLRRDGSGLFIQWNSIINPNISSSLCPLFTRITLCLTLCWPKDMGFLAKRKTMPQWEWDLTSYREYQTFCIRSSSSLIFPSSFPFLLSFPLSLPPFLHLSVLPPCLLSPSLSPSLPPWLPPSLPSFFIF